MSSILVLAGRLFRAASFALPKQMGRSYRCSGVVTARMRGCCGTDRSIRLACCGRLMSCFNCAAYRASFRAVSPTILFGWDVTLNARKVSHESYARWFHACITPKKANWVTFFDFIVALDCGEARCRRASEVLR